MTSVAIDSLDKISKVLDVELSSFFNMSDTANDLHIVRRYEQKSTIVNPEIVEYSLTNNITDFDLLPRLVELMPALQKEDELELIHMVARNSSTFWRAFLLYRLAVISTTCIRVTPHISIRTFPTTGKMIRMQLQGF